MNGNNSITAKVMNVGIISTFMTFAVMLSYLSSTKRKAWCTPPAPPPPPSELTYSFMKQGVFCQKKNKHETRLKSFLIGASHTKKNPVSVP